MSFTDNQKDTLSSQLVDRLREEIISGKLIPGTKINLARVREQFDISLSPLREALARLIADGLVEFQDNRGYWVSPVSIENLCEITQLRVHFETYALRLAIEAADIKWEADLMTALHRLNFAERRAAEPETIELWEKLHREFHTTLISGCKMPTLVAFCRQLLNLNDRYRRVFLLQTSGDRSVNTEHSEIVESAVNHDAATACAKLAQHLKRTGSNLKAHLQQNPNPALIFHESNG